MPKRARDEGWVGRTVMLKPHAASGKRLPEAAVLKVVGVSVDAKTARFTLQYTVNGVTRTTKDVFPAEADPAERFAVVEAESAPLNREKFVREWSFQGPAQAPTRHGLPLCDVLPAFQLQQNVEQPALADARDPRAAVTAALACAIAPFRFEDLLRVSCEGLCFESDPTQRCLAEAQERQQRDGFLDEVFRGRAPDAARKVGRCVLHPWQAAVVARLVRMAEGPESMVADFTCSVSRHVVRVQCLAPQRAAILHAGTGMGKTFVASALALARGLTYCVALPNSTRQWVREATKIGVKAVWAESSFSFRASVVALAEEGGLVIISHTLLRSSYFWKLALPTPELLIIDEVHKARSEFPEPVFRFAQQFRGVFTLGLTATLTSEDGRTELGVAHLLGIHPRALSAAVINVPSTANCAAFPTATFHFRAVRLSGIERSAYIVATEIGDGVIRAMLFPASAERQGRFRTSVWADIMRSLTAANRKVETDLVAVLTRAANRAAHRPELEARLGPSVTARVYEIVDRRIPETFDPGALTRRRIDTVWRSRARLLGAYAFAADVLTKLGAEASIECPVCFESVNDYCLAACGHFACRDCAPQLQRCPLCRVTATWRSGRALQQQLAATQEPEPEENERQTSAKFLELAGIIAGLGDTERVLVISPLKTMLREAQAEMAKLGTELAILQGGAVEQQATLRRWESGACKGLLSDPDLPALNLSQASAVVFLSPMLTDTHFTQAAGRVVRQGSLHASVRVIVLGAANTIEDEDAGKLERFRAIAERSAPSAASSGA